jgi:hypothetical protein
MHIKSDGTKIGGVKKMAQLTAAVPDKGSMTRGNDHGHGTRSSFVVRWPENTVPNCHFDAKVDA